MATLANTAATVDPIATPRRTQHSHSDAFCKHPLWRPLPTSAVFRGPCPVRRGHVAARAAAHNGAGEQAVLSGVDELPDGTVVLHFAPEESPEGDTPEDEKHLVTFLTKPVKGRRKRRVPTEVLEHVLGTHYHGYGNPVYSIKSFVKGVLSPPQQHPRHGGTAQEETPAPAAPAPVAHLTAPLHAATSSPYSAAAATAAVAAPVQMASEPNPRRAAAAAVAGEGTAEAAGTAAAAGAGSAAAASEREETQAPDSRTEAAKPGLALSAPSKVSGQSRFSTVVEARRGVDGVRVVAVGVAAALASAVVRVLAALNAFTLPWASLASRAGVLACFAASFAFLWVTGFACAPTGEATA